MTKVSEEQDRRVFLSNLTSAPGVYQMLDDAGEVLYVGKASNLKKRVSSYFRANVGSVKTESLVSQIKAINITVTRSETEALLLEHNLIKLHRPKYNVLMRDDKSYPFIHISSHPKYPKIEAVRRKKKPETGDFFGPYPNVVALRETMNLIYKLFKIRNCSDANFASRSRPCLQYHIKRCTGPCVELISQEAYAQSIQDAKYFLQGKSQHMMKTFTQRMQAAVDELDFEKAAMIRDQIKHLRAVQEQQGMVQSKGDADVVLVHAVSGFACIQFVRIRHGDVITCSSFFPSVPASEESDLWQQVFSAFVTYYYIDTPERIPSQILTDRSVEDSAGLESLLGSLRGSLCKIKQGKRGALAKWIDFAEQNLQQSLAQHNVSTDVLNMRINALQDFMGLSKPITHIDCFDVSHFQGDATVASCVVFDAQGPLKREYRRFNISGITPGDDYAAMEQAMLRRYQTEGRYVPEVLIVDGGHLQLAVAKRVLAKLNLEHIALLGVAKGPSRKEGWEHLIVDGDTPMLPPHSPVRHLIQHIRDEAHRFAISAHRKKRQTQSMHSPLEDIEGIGPRRRKALLQRFGGLRELSHASVEELLKVTGISQDLAQRIFKHFHP